MFVPQEAGDLSVSDITVVIPTSPIPSHPSTRIIDEAIVSVRTQLPDAPIIITADGTGEQAESYNQTYISYVDALRSRWPSLTITLYGNHVHQSGMMSDTLPRIATKLLLYWEHDWKLHPDVPWEEMSQLILRGEFNYIKLHASPRISPYHEFLMRERVMFQGYAPNDRYVDGIPGSVLSIIKTQQFSANPHLASVEWYRTIERKHLFGKCDFVEHLLHGPAAQLPWEEWKLGILNPMSGDMFRIHHLDGRGSV